MSHTAEQKEAWIKEAEAIMRQYLPNDARGYAESLYESFVVESDSEMTPAEAVAEDMTYWDADE